MGVVGVGGLIRRKVFICPPKFDHILERMRYREIERFQEFVFIALSHRSVVDYMVFLFF